MQQEINDVLGSNYSVPDDIDESELMGELDSLEAELASEPAGVPAYLQVGLYARCMHVRVSIGHYLCPLCWFWLLC